MKNNLRQFILIITGCLAFVYFSMPAYAQSPEDDFTSDLYREAIQDIIDAPGGKLDREAVLGILASPQLAEKGQMENLLLTRGDTIYMVPEIALVHYDSLFVDFNYFPDTTFHLDSLSLTFPENPNWVDTTTFTIDSIPSKIRIFTQVNPDFEPRSTPVKLTGKINFNSVSYTSYILQQPRPQPIIIVSPKYQAMGPAQDTTDPFTVTHFNIAGWKAIIDTSDNWIDTISTTQEMLHFNVAENLGDQSREAKIYIRDSLNPEIQDSLIIFQYVDTSAFIIVTPASSFIGPDSATVSVSVNSNINWIPVIDVNPGGMITGSNSSASAISFNVAENTSISRTAIITVQGVDHPDVTAEIQIIQAAQSPAYLYVSPGNSYVGSEADTVELNVEANVDWVSRITENPDGMLSRIDSTDNSIKFAVVENPGTASRTATGEIKAGDLTAPFSITQQASYILLGPDSKLVPCQNSSFGVDVTRYNVESISFGGNSFSQVNKINNDSLFITVPENPDNTSRTDTIFVCSVQNPSICDTLLIFQYACNQSYILLSPRGQIVNWDQTDLPTPFVITSQNTGTLSASSNKAWLTPSIQDDKVFATIGQNPDTAAREGMIIVKDDNVADTVIVTQGGSLTYIFITPEFRTLPYYADTTDPFTVISGNVDTFEVLIDPSVDWITDTIIDGNQVKFVADTNQLIEPRQVTFKLVSTDNDNVLDSAVIIQDGAPKQILLATPREQKIAHSGIDEVIFEITSVNVTDWQIVPDNLPDWIEENPRPHMDTLSLKVLSNPSDTTRYHTVWIESIDNPQIRDSVKIYQYSGLDHYLLAAPREQETDYLEEVLNFDVTAVNLSEDWKVEIAEGSDWIDTLSYGTDLLSLEISKNNSDTTRQGLIRIFSTGFPDAKDSVDVYQYAAPDPVLLVSPREQKIAHTGATAVIFEITTVNLGDWEIVTEGLDNWIQVNSPHQLDTLSLKVLPNDGLQTRVDTVWVQALENNDIKDSVLIYQYSGLDHYLLADPREQKTDYQADVLNFEVTMVNLNNPWAVEIVEGSQWITNILSGADLLSLDIAKNNSDTTRQGLIRIFSNEFPNAKDSVFIYQYAGPDSLLLASPRERKIEHTGKDMVVFDITSINITDWKITDNNLPGWIVENLPHQMDSLKLKVLLNPSDTTRYHTVWIESTDNPQIRDSVKIYQYSGLDHYLIAAPREQETDYQEAILNFDITRVNIDTPWNFEIIQVGNWVSVINSGGDLLTLDISENGSLASREAKIRILSTEFPDAKDSVYVYQYARPDSLLLASPREQWVEHLGDMDVVFDVTYVNFDEWQIVDGSLPEDNWIVENLPHQLDTLSLSVEPNPSDTTRYHTIWIEAIGNPSVSDSISIYQYSGLDHYLLAAPREQETEYFEDTLYFDITAVNLTEDWTYEIEQQGNWITVLNSGTNSLNLKISENDTTTTRTAVVRIFSNEFPEAKDSVYVYQYAGPDRYLLVAPREQKIAHTGNTDVVFDVTSVNIADWNVDEASLQEWVHLNDSTAPDKFSLKVDPNDTIVTRVDTVWIEARGYPEIKDSVLIYQYASNTPYVLIAPREQNINFAGGELPLPFVITTNLVEEWDFSYDTTWIDVVREVDSLDVSVDSSLFNYSRNTIIKAFNVADPAIYDSVSVFQGSNADPYIVLHPAGLSKNISSNGDTLSVSSFSNLETYIVEPGTDSTWYSINKTNLSYNDSVVLFVEENEDSYLSRSSYLKFKSPDDSVVEYFYFQQNKNSPNYIPVKGQILVNGDQETPIDSAKVYIGQDSTYIRSGDFGMLNDSVLYGWVGAITPEIGEYYFEPGSYVFELGQTDTITANFTAVPIDPKVTVSVDSTARCWGDSLYPGQTDYPVPIITNTYGQSAYKWLSDPYDSELDSNYTGTITLPAFKPDTSTVYSLVLYNYQTTDTAIFMLTVHTKPVARDFDGPMSVCRNQAGVIYTAEDSLASGEYFSWKLSGGGAFLTEPNSNIAIVDWGNDPGEYQLSLFTYNKFGCSQDSLSRDISISTSQAPPKSIVEKKQGDNMLLCNDANANLFYKWGWNTIDSITGHLSADSIISDKNEWYCRLPHDFNPIKYKYFVITGYDTLGCGSKSFYNPPVDIEDIATNEILIYPNPTDGAINIKFNNQGLDQSAILEMYNISGRLLYQKMLHDIGANNTFSINETSYLKPGIYFIRIRSKGIFYNSKIVVQ